MGIFWPEGLQKLADSGEITFKDGERLNLNVIRKMDNGLYLIGLKGKSFTANLQTEPEGKTVRAEVVKNQNGTLQLKIIPKAENSSNPMQVSTKTSTIPKMHVQTVSTQTTTQTGTQNAGQGATSSPAGSTVVSTDPKNLSNLIQQAVTQQVSTQPSAAPQTPAPVSSLEKLIFQIQSGTVNVKEGEKVPIQILKTLDNGNTMVSLKNNLFEVKLGPQLVKSIQAEVIKISDDIIQLAADKMPVQNLDPTFVKQQVGTFDIEKIMKAFGKFQKLDISNITPENLKSTLRNSGLFMENKLLHSENMDGDEKLKAYLNSDTQAKDGITKMQITNMMLAGGIFAFLKTQDESIDDTYMRFKKGDKGQNILYISTRFSQLGETMLIVRNVKDTFDILVKTEVDISEELKEISFENTRIHWNKFNTQDKSVMDVKNELVFNMGKFEVLI